MAAPFDNMNGYGMVLPHFRSVPYKASFEMNATKFQVCKPLVTKMRSVLYADGHAV